MTAELWPGQARWVREVRASWLHWHRVMAARCEDDPSPYSQQAAATHRALAAAWEVAFWKDVRP